MSATKSGFAGSLNAPTRAAITNAQALMALERMRGYFDAGKPTYAWFNGLGRVVEGMGFSFAEHSAAHLDLVQEATKPAWSGLRSEDRAQADAVLERDLPFLQQQIERLPLRAVVCTSARVLNNVSAMLQARKIAEGTEALIKWTVLVADTQRGAVGVAGWNIPLARPTGLDRAGQRGLGVILKRELERAGVFF